MKTQYEIVETKASPFGELYVISEFLHRIQFQKLFTSIFGKLRRHRLYQPVDNINLIIASIIAGSERLYDIQRFSSDPVIPDYVERTKRDRHQGDLFEPDEYTYRVIVSNRDYQPHIIFNHYNKRGRCEKNIEE